MKNLKLFAMTENEMKSIGNKVKETIPQTHGYAIFVFPFDRPGICNYVSNGKRSQMIGAISEIKQRLESGEVFTFNQN